MESDEGGPWVGAVLTGGSSRRMGRDKATLEVDGVAMAERVAAALTVAGASDVVCVGPPVGPYPAIAEEEPGEGPLGGVLAALRWADGRVVFVAACDLIDPDPTAVAAIVAALGPASVAVPVRHGRDQPLTAAYGPGALAGLATAYAEGERSVRRALRRVDVVTVEGIDPAALADADDPSDLPSGPQPRNLAGMPVPEIDVDELAHLRKGDVPLIDVREPHEYTEFHAAGAVLLPLGQVAARIDEVPRGETVYIICRSGSRSAKAAAHLIANGIEAVNVAGGSLAWRSAGYPVVAGSDPG